MKIKFAITMADANNFNLENKNIDGVVIRLGDLKHLIERINIRFGLRPNEIGRRLKLHERSVLKLMSMKITKETIEI